MITMESMRLWKLQSLIILAKLVKLKVDAV
jgi:hypothetical protein